MSDGDWRDRSKGSEMHEDSRMRREGKKRGGRSDDKRDNFSFLFFSSPEDARAISSPSQIIGLLRTSETLSFPFFPFSF